MTVYLARRMLFSGRTRFVPLLAGVALAGSTLSLFFLTLVLGVLNGFQSELQSRWIGLNAHLTAVAAPSTNKKLDAWSKEIKSWPEIRSVGRFIEGEVIFQSGETSAAGRLKGFEKLTGDFLQKVDLSPADTEGWSLLAGEELLSVLGAHPEWDETISLLYPFGEIGPTGDWVARKLVVKPSHRFRSGLYLWDAYTAIVPLEEGRRLLSQKGREGVQIFLNDFSALDKVEKKLRAAAPAGVTLESFAKQNERLFAALKLERIGMFFLLILFLLVASFSLAGLLSLFLSAKRKDLAILRALGLTGVGARNLFWSAALWLGGIGTLLGAVLGAAALFYLEKNPVRLPPTYYLDFLPVKGGMTLSLLVLCFGFFLSWSASWIPARQAARMEILPLLREE